MDYKEIFNEFADSYKEQETSPEKVGIVVMKLSSIYANYNLQATKSESKYRGVLSTHACEIENNKPITAAKAKIMAEATEDYQQFIIDKAHIDNINQHINALKALLKSTAQEYQHASTM